MEGKPVYTNDSADELDLIVLIGKFISFARKYGKALVAGAACGVLIGFIIFKTLPHLYSAKLVLHSTVLTNSEEIEVVSNWNELLEHGEFKKVAADFNCSPEIVRKLRSLSALEIEKAPVQKVPGQNIVGFVVEILVDNRDTAILDSLETGIVYGLENNEYAKSWVDTRKSDLIVLSAKTKMEIARLDSTKRNVENSFHSGKPGGSSFIIDISGINREMINLSEKQLDYEEKLKFVNAIFVLQFTGFNIPASPKLPMLLALGFAGGLCLSFFICVCLVIKTRLRGYKPPH